jgi:hypothetical protein
VQRCGSQFRQISSFMSVYGLPYRLLGHEIEPAALRSDVPLSLIQGGPLRAHPESQRLRCTPVCNSVCS